MKIDFFLWYIIPLVLSFFILIKSISNTLKYRFYFNYLISGILIIVISFSQEIQYEIFFKNAWPTYLPCIFIGLSLIILMIQNVFY